MSAAADTPVDACPRCRSAGFPVRTRTLALGCLQRERRCVACGTGWETVELPLTLAQQLLALTGAFLRQGDPPDESL